MQRIFLRQVTTIQITSVEVFWDDEVHSGHSEMVKTVTLPAKDPTVKPRGRQQKNKPATSRKPRMHKNKTVFQAPAQHEFVISEPIQNSKE
jgi:hypothetical protein